MEAMEGMRKFLVTKAVQTNDHLKESPGDFIHDKLAQLLHSIQHWFASLASAADRIFPPGSRPTWIHIGLAVAGALLVLYCILSALLTVLSAIYRVVAGALSAVARCLCCCCRGSGGRMMRAPGRGGVVMRRHRFEANPRDYFQDLRAGKSLVY